MWPKKDGMTSDGSYELRSLITVDFPDGTYRTQWTKHNEVTETFEGYDDEDYWITNTEEYTHDETYFLELPSTEFVKHLSGRMPPGMENLGSARSNLLDAGTSLEPGGGIPYVPVPEAKPATAPDEMAKPVLAETNEPSPFYADSIANQRFSLEEMLRFTSERIPDAIKNFKKDPIHVVGAEDGWWMGTGGMTLTGLGMLTSVGPALKSGQLTLGNIWTLFADEIVSNLFPVNPKHVADAGQQLIKNISKTAEAGGLCLFKWGKPQTKLNGWQTGDHFLFLPNLNDAKENWKQNSRRLREKMREEKQIFDTHIDATSGMQIPTKGFLNAERDLLETRGWIFLSSKGAYIPPTITTKK